MTAPPIIEPESRLDALRTSWPLTLGLLPSFVIAVAGAVATWAVIGLLTVHVYEGGWLHEQEARFTVWFESIRTDELTDLSRWMTRLADTEIIIGLAVVFSIFAVRRWHRWIDALFVFGSLATQAAVFLVVSLITDRDRPPVLQLDGSLPTASFPSGHTGAATAFYLSLLVVSLWHLRHPVLRYVVPLMLVLFPAAVITSRLYRGMHYPTDVLAGFTNGLVSIIVMAWILDRGITGLRNRSDAGYLPERTMQFSMVAAPSGRVVGDAGE